jgi:hypothetical protein
MWQPQVGRVGLHHRDGVVREPLSQITGAARMQFHRDYPGAGSDQVASQGAPAGADVED